MLFGAMPAISQTITGAGATFPAPIYQKWFFEYHKSHGGVTINYQPVGSGAGYALYKAGTVDFGASDAPLTDAELGAVPWPTLHIPTVAGAIVMAYNIPGVGPGLKLSGDVIADIYLGKITTWNHPRITGQNPGVNLPATNISVVHRSDGSGTTYIYTNYLSAVSGEWREKVGAGKSVNWRVGIGGKGNDGVAGLVRNAPGSIGYVELAYAVQTKLHYGPIKNLGGEIRRSIHRIDDRSGECGCRPNEKGCEGLHRGRTWSKHVSHRGLHLPAGLQGSARSREGARPGRILEVGDGPRSAHGGRAAVRAASARGRRFE